MLPSFMDKYKAQAHTHCSTANMGPGFDNCGGAFKDLFLYAEAIPTPKPGLEIEFAGKYKFPTDGRSRPRKVYDSIVEAFGDKINRGLKIHFYNYIKDGGLGTSAANCVATAEFMNHFFNLGLTRQQVVYYAAKGEPGHEDNTNACVYGGVVFAKEFSESGPWQFEPHPVPKDIIPALVIPLKIDKKGGTEQARAALQKTKEKNLNPQEIVLRNKLYRQLVEGFDGNNFDLVREVIEEYTAWEKSITFVRNEDGIYQVDVNALNSRLESAVGKNAVLTPSGAGPVMQIFARDPDIARRGLEAVLGGYEAIGHSRNLVDTLVTSFEDSHSIIIE